MTATRLRYHTIALTLHWLIAAAMIGQLTLGWLMTAAPKGAAAFALFQVHKSIGFSILALSLLRLAWRVGHPPPPLPAALVSWEQWAAKLTHIGFYVLMLGLPLTGWLLVSSSRTNIPTLLFGVLPWPHIPMPTSFKEGVHGFSEESHELLAVGLVALLLLHLGAVLKHQLIIKDHTLGRMLPRARAGWQEPRLWAVLASLPLIAAMTAAYVHNSTQAKATPQSAPEAEPPVTLETPATPAEPAPTVASATADQAVVADSKPKVKAKAEKWLVNAGGHLNFNSAWSGDVIRGEFKHWQANIVFHPQDLEHSKITVKVDVASASTGDDQRDAALPTADWFDVANHPQAVFTASNFKQIAEHRYLARGKLQLRGVTAPLNLSFNLVIKDQKATVDGSAAIDRTVFGVGQGEFAATDQVPAAVGIKFKFAAHQ